MATSTNFPTLLSGPPPIFTPEPSGRGTIGLITSCTVTFIICVWTAVHTDIAPPRSSALLRLSYKFLWVSGAALMPEGTIVSAYGQWREARRVQRCWSAVFDCPDIPNQCRKITLEEAFFVVMGGFTVFECTDEYGVTYRNTLTPHGFMEYVREGWIDSALFERSNVGDKGKASLIAKGIACVQAGWLLVQCVARKVVGLPLTLLEFHMVIQVMYAMVIYALWWCKPLDVQEPIPIQLLPKGRGEVHDGSAILLMGKEPLLHAPEGREYGYDSHSDFNLQQVKAHFALQSSLSPQNVLFITRRGPSTLLATVMHATYDTVKYLYNDLGIVIIGLLLTCITGGLHALAWNAHFPTQLERFLWCGSSLGIAVAAVSIGVISSWGAYHQIPVRVTFQLSFIDCGLWDLPAFMVDACTKLTAAGREKGRIHVVLVWVCALVCYLYGLCIWIITVESYLSVRSPPEGAFETPRWSNYWPHL